VRLVVAALLVCATLSARSASAAVTLDARTQDSARPTPLINVTTLTVGPGSDRLLVVGIEIADPGVTVSRMAWAGVSLVRAASLKVNMGGSGCLTEIWRLVAPATGNNVLEVALSAPAAFGIGAASYTGVDQNTPTETFASDTGSDTDVVLVGTPVAGHPIFGSACLGGNWPDRMTAPAAMAMPAAIVLWDFTEQGVVGLGAQRADITGSLRWSIQSMNHYVWAGLGLLLVPAGAAGPLDAGAPEGGSPDGSPIDVAPDASPPDAARPDDRPPPPPDRMPPDLPSPAADGGDSAAREPDAMTEPDAGPGRDAGTEPDAGSAVPDLRLRVGCACRTDGAASPGGMPLLLLLALGLFRPRRRY
jgi:MYXO-CTERM domain-containing protein